ncbi:helix-turn-helix domain-containing protein [Xenorhabdus yunnanensis]|uniref:helix-turn-helix domain-containing protein n=1 Tax=Xenorhabdus yunnanensis TaxID=3025878 RepID=UPI00359C82DB
MKVFDNLLAEAKSSQENPLQTNSITEEAISKNRLQVLREELNFPLRTIAEALNIPMSSILQIERLDQNVKLSTLKRYIEVMGGKLSLWIKLPNGDIRTIKI